MNPEEPKTKKVTIQVHATINPGPVTIGRDISRCSRCGQELKKEKK